MIPPSSGNLMASRKESASDPLRHSATAAIASEKQLKVWMDPNCLLIGRSTTSPHAGTRPQSKNLGIF